MKHSRSAVTSSVLGLGVAVFAAVPVVDVSAAGTAPEVRIGITAPSGKIAAFRGRVMWSEPVGPVLQRRYVLRQRFKGRTSRVPVPSRARRAFDVDLGPDGHGGTLAVYSRCGNESRRRGCDVYRYDVQRGREDKLRAISTRSATEQLPSVWGSRIAFVRGVLASSAKLVVANYRTGRATRLEGGTASGARGPSGRAPTRSSYGPVARELNDRRLAFAWDTVPAQCPSELASNVREDAPRRLSSELWLVTLGGGRRRVAAGCTGSALSAVADPILR